jgi:hypothetical protein
MVFDRRQAERSGGILIDVCVRRAAPAGAAAGGSLVVGPDLGKHGGRSARVPYEPVGTVDQVESLHDRGLLGDRHPHVMLADGLPVELPAAP